MKKSLVVVFCVIILSSLLAVPLLLKPPSAASQSEQQATPQSTPQPTPNTTPESISQSIPKNTPETTESTPTSGLQPTNQPTNDKLEVAVNNAINYIAQTQEPYALLMLNVLYRRFGIPEFNDSLQRYDQILTSYPHPLLQVYRRIADHNNTLDETDFNAVVDVMDTITVPALYSDQRSLPDNYPSVLINAKNSGDYMMTHALLATIWLQENNCNISLPDNFIETLYHDTAALTDRGPPITDLALEAAAFLYMAGQGNLVDPAFVQNVIAAQFTNGGWSTTQNEPYNTNWHPSVLALMILLHVAHPAASHPPMIAPAPS